MKTFAHFLSYALHPLFMPLLTVWLALELDPHLGYFLPPPGRWMMLGMLGIMTIAFPITSALMLQRAGLISSLQMPDHRERTAPFTITLIYCGMAYYLLGKTPLHPLVHAMFLGVLLALLLTILINVRWKISAHMVGIGGLVGALIGIAVVHALPLLPVVALVIVAGGVLGAARLYITDHTQAQILLGAALGSSCTYAAVVSGWTF